MLVIEVCMDGMRDGEIQALLLLYLEQDNDDADADDNDIGGVTFIEFSLKHDTKSLIFRI